jgi:hypothetical protein
MVLRLPGIYGPGRSAPLSPWIVKPGQVFSRIHVAIWRAVGLHTPVELQRAMMNWRWWMKCWLCGGTAGVERACCCIPRRLSPMAQRFYRGGQRTKRHRQSLARLRPIEAGDC